MDTPTPSASSMPRKALVTSAVALVVVAFVVTMTSTPTPPKVGDIPLPFGVSSTALQGAITSMGQRGGIDVFEATFQAGEPTATLDEDRIYLVRVPAGADIANVPLSLAVTRRENGADTYDVDFYGYRYGDAFATLERRDISAPEFKDRFPGQFFASPKAKLNDPQHGDGLANFAAQNEVTFLPTNSEQGSVRLQPNSLYVFIVNESSSATVRVRGITGCGNGIVENAEKCDDGNSDNLDTCTNTCNIGVPLPFGGSSSSSLPPLPFGGSSSAAVTSSVSTSASATSSSTGFNSSNDTFLSSSSSALSSSESAGGAPLESSSSSASSEASSVSSSLAAPSCGDGILNGTEECDDGNNTDTDECSNSCIFLVPVPSFE